VSGCSGYDCEFVALAGRIGVPLLSGEKRLLSAFPETVVAADAFVARFHAT